MFKFKFEPYITVVGENGLTVNFELTELNTFMANGIEFEKDYNSKDTLIWCDETYIETKPLILFSLVIKNSSKYKLFCDSVTQIILHPYRSKRRSVTLHLDTNAKIIHNKDINTMIISNLSEINNKEERGTNG